MGSLTLLGGGVLTAIVISCAFARWREVRLFRRFRTELNQLRAGPPGPERDMLRSGSPEAGRGCGEIAAENLPFSLEVLRKQVLRLSCDGLSAAEIGRELHLPAVEVRLLLAAQAASN